MIHLSRWSIRRPRLALLIWVALAIALSAIGSGLIDKLSPSVTVVTGSESARAEQLAEDEFGPSVLVPILLEGPKAQLDRQGPVLVRELAKRGDTRVLSAWDAGDTGKALRPKPDAAMVIASVARTEKQMVETYQDQIDATVDKVVADPVKPYISGTPTIDQAMKDESIDTALRAELIAIPILFVVLLLLLRAPVAAAGIALFGGATVLSGFGAMALVGQVMDIDAVAVAGASMIGLGVAVAYSLVLFTRWREDLAGEGSHQGATWSAVHAVETTGRAVLIGGTALSLTLILASMLGPSEIMNSIGVGALLCSVLAIGTAVVVMPATLALLGLRMEALSFPAPRFVQRAWGVAVAGGNFVVRRAVIVGALATAGLVALAIPALSIETGPPSPSLLPESNQARVSFEEIGKVMGPGYATPFNIVVVSKDKPITDKGLLKQLDMFQTGIAKDPRVASVVGPGSIYASATELDALPKTLKNSGKLLKGGKKDLGKLQAGLGKAGAGALTLQQGLREAANGASQASSGSGQLESGSGQLAAGLDKARSGASQISAGLGSALSGAKQLRDGAAAALSGSKQLKGGLGQAAPTVAAGVPVVKKMAADIASSTGTVRDAAGTTSALAAQLDEALAKMQAMQTGKDDPAYQAALGALGSARNAAGSVQSALGGASQALTGASGIATAFAGQVAELSSGLQQLYAGSSALTNGIGQLQKGNSDLAAGIGKLYGGGGQLTSGLTQLRNGAGQLQAGLGQLTSGTGQLATGLNEGTGPVGQLAAGLGTMEKGVAKFKGQLPSPKDLEKLNASSPGLFDSGYFVLAAVAGSPAAARNQASFAVNLDRGGSAGQIVVVSKYALEDERTQELGDDLATVTDNFAETTGTEAALGGPAGELGDFESESLAMLAGVIVGIALVISLLLAAMLRTIVLPVVAVAFDLLTAAASFGLLWLLFRGDDPIMGGPGYIDPVSIIAIFSSVFGLTIFYEVMLLQRTREEFMRSGDPHEAIRRGLKQTAFASTGAAIAMLAVFVPFVMTDLITVKQLGVGVTAAVLLDALIVRPVLLPAAVRVLGRRSWWPSSRSAPPTPPAGPPELDREAILHRPKEEAGPLLPA